MRRSKGTHLAAATIAWLLALPVAAGDLFREPICLGVEGGGAPDSDRALVKLIRWPYATEQPFHVLPADPLDETQASDAATHVRYHGHGGVILEGPNSSPWNADIEMQAGFARGPPPGSPLCESGLQLNVPQARITTDPYTGNLFVGRIRDDRIRLAIFDRSGGLLVEIRSDLFFRSPLPDLTGGSRAEIDPAETPEFFWFAREKLAGFVDVYRRIGGAGYARFLVDAFLTEAIFRDRADDNGAAGPRLPFLPGPRIEEVTEAEEIDNLRGLRTTYRQAFIRGKPRKGGVSCALMPVLKMLEDRDCRDGAENEAGKAPPASSCPAYSPMALQTELFRDYPETMRHRGYALHQVFETLVERGVCTEARYPMLSDVAIGRTRSVEQFGARAEQELNRILEAGETSATAGFREFLTRTPRGEMRFEEQQPPLCREEMRAYGDAHPMRAHDLVDLLASQSWFEAALSREATNELLRAQKQELLRLMERLLRAGLLVAVAGDRGSLEQHAVLAYGRNSKGFLIMDSDLASEAARRRTVVPAGHLERMLSGVAYLRDEVPVARPTAEQLSASLSVLPDIGWTHDRLADLYREQGRHREALPHLRHVLESDPGRAKRWLDLGESLLVLGLFEEALEATGNAMAGGLEGRYAQAQRGYALRKLGRLEEAEVALRVATGDEHSWEWVQLGWTLFDLGRDDEAERCFRKAVEIGPRSIGNHVELAEFLFYAGRGEDAREVLLFAATLDFDPSARTWLGSWLGVLGSYDDAIPLLEGVLGEEPDQDEARLALARIHHRQDRPDRTAAVLQPLIGELASLVAGGESGYGSWIRLAYTQALAGDTAACKKTVASLQQTFDRLEGPQLYDIACVQALNGDTDRALDSLERAFQRGFDDYRWARRDPDLRSLAGNPRLARIFTRHGSHER